MELNYIKEFVVLAEMGNYLKASESLFIAQSSLSKHIQALEKELNVSLFDRTTRSVCLSEYGKVFLEYAKQITTLQYEYKTALLNLQESVNQTISIGSIPVMSPYGITNAIIKFKKENKNFAVNIIEGESAQLKEMLRRNTCELAFIRDDGKEDDEFARIPFTDDHLAAILPKYHALANRKTIHLEELKNEDFLLLQPNSMLYQLCMKCCEKIGYIPNVAFTGQRAENLVDLVEKGMGISLLMRKPIQYLANENVRVIDVVPSIETKIMLYYRKDNMLSIGAKHFIDCLRSRL